MYPGQTLQANLCNICDHKMTVLRAEVHNINLEYTRDAIKPHPIHLLILAIEFYIFILAVSPPSNSLYEKCAYSYKLTSKANLFSIYAWEHVMVKSL